MSISIRTNSCSVIYWGTSLDLLPSRYSGGKVVRTLKVEVQPFLLSLNRVTITCSLIDSFPLAALKFGPLFPSKPKKGQQNLFVLYCQFCIYFSYSIPYIYICLCNFITFSNLITNLDAHNLLGALPLLLKILVLFIFNSISQWTELW